MGAKLKVAGILAVGAVAGALTTMQLQAVARSALAPLPLEEVQQLAAVFGMVKTEYVEPVDEKKLINDAIAGMVAGLDPHSQYFDKKTFKEFRESTGGKFVGIGIEMGMEDGLVKVVSPIEGSPAFRAGLKSGDLITRIDDTPVKGMTVDQAVKRMRGEPNTKVMLTVFRKAESRTFPVTIIREEIRMQSVRAKMIEPGYGWVRVSQFQDRTVDDFVRKVEELYKQDPNLKGLVLDLRNDPGGLLDGAVALSAAFLPADVVVVTDQRPDRRVARHLQGQPRVLRAPRRHRPAAPPARGAEDRAAGGAGQRRLGLGQRDRRRRAAGPQARHHHGRADLRQGLGADGAPAAGRHGAEDHHRALLHAERPLDPGQGHRARRLARRDRRRQCLRRAAHARGRPRQAPAAAPTRAKDAAREKAREEARKKLEEQMAKTKEAAQAAARVRQRRGLPAATGAEPVQGPAGAGRARPSSAAPRREPTPTK